MKQKRVMVKMRQSNFIRREESLLVHVIPYYVRILMKYIHIHLNIIVVCTLEKLILHFFCCMYARACLGIVYKGPVYSKRQKGSLNLIDLCPYEHSTRHMTE